MSIHKPFKSETKLIVASTTQEFADFVPLRGPTGGRVVVDGFTVCITGVITVATADWHSEAQPRIMNLITIEQRDGRQRWNLSGYRSRIASKILAGSELYNESAAVAIAAGAAVDIRHYIPMTKPRSTFRPKDFALPADMFRKVIVNWASLAAAGSGTTALSAATLNAYVLAHWHEEHNVEFKCEDLIKQVDGITTTQGKLTLNGVLHDLYLVKEDTTLAGALITAITDARIEELGTPVLTRQDLVLQYRYQRKYGNPAAAAAELIATDPVLAGKALPLIVSDDDTSVTDGKVLASMKIDLGTGLAAHSYITREVVSKSEAGYSATVAEFNVNTADIRVKTEGKTKRDIRSWSKKDASLLPWSAPLTKAS